jgi:hypoxanthine phosphoribosyltransferase
MWARAGAYVLEWHDIGRILADIEREVRASGFQPTTVLAVARGGLVAGSYLATVLGTPTMATIRVRRTTSDDRYADKQEPVVEPFGGAELAADDRVLVVDDIVGTGATAELVRDHVLAAGVAELRFATLVRNHLSPVAVDYQGVVADDWVIFPWEDGWHRRPEGWRSLP